MTHWPSRVKSVLVERTASPVTAAAEVAVNNASMKVMGRVVIPGSSSNTVVVSLFDDGILIVLDARRPGVDEFSEFSDFVDFDRSVVVGALAAPGRSLALRGLPPLFGSIAHRWRLRNIFQSRLDWASDSRRRWLRLGERECESAILLLEFFVGVIGVGAGTVDD